MLLLGYSTTLAWTNNLSNWTTTTLPQSATWTTITFSPTLNRYLIMDSVGKILRSDDFGVTWIDDGVDLEGSLSNDCERIMWVPFLELFVATSSVDFEYVNIFTSPDGITWTKQYTTGQFHILRNGYYVEEFGIILLNFSHFEGSRIRTYYSYDGIEWNVGTVDVNPGAQASFQSAWSPKLGKFIGIRGRRESPNITPAVYESTNGYDWKMVRNFTEISSSFHFYQPSNTLITWAPHLNKFVLLGNANSGENNYGMSSDGRFWDTSSDTLPHQTWQKLQYIPVMNKLVAVSTTGVYESTDGEEWTEIETIGTSGSWHDFYMATNYVELNPHPTITTVVPNAIEIGTEEDITIEVHGSNFRYNSIVGLENVGLETTYIDRSTLEAVVPSSFAEQIQSLTLSVTTPPPGGGTASRTYEIVDIRPKPTTIDPVLMNVGSESFWLTIEGSDFFDGCVVTWDDAPLPTNFISSTKIEAYVDESLLTASGTHNIIVINPSGAPSNVIEYVVSRFEDVPVSLVDIGVGTPTIDHDTNSVIMHGGNSSALSAGTNVGFNVDLTGWTAIAISFERIWGLSFYDDDFSDSEFTISLYFQKHFEDVDYPSTSWTYNRPRSSNTNGIGFLCGYRRTYTFPPAANYFHHNVGVLTNDYLMTEVATGSSSEDSNPATIRHVWTPDFYNEQFTTSIYINNVLRWERTAACPDINIVSDFSVASVGFHYHRYSNTGVGVTLNNITCEVNR